MIIDVPTKISLNGYEFLFEAGDIITIKGKEEVINEGQLKNLGNKRKKLYKLQSDIEINIRTEKDRKKLKSLNANKMNVDQAIADCNAEITAFYDRLAKRGYDKTSLNNLAKNFIRGNQEEAEKEKKLRISQEISSSEDRIETLRTELETAKDAYEEFKENNGYVIQNGQWQALGDNNEYLPLSDEQSNEMGEISGDINELKAEIEKEERLNLARDFEENEEGTSGSIETGAPEQVDRIITKDEMKSGSMPTSDDPWDDPSGIPIGDEISRWLIDGGFQPEELGTYSSMTQDLDNIGKNLEKALSNV